MEIIFSHLKKNLLFISPIIPIQFEPCPLSARGPTLPEQGFESILLCLLPEDRVPVKPAPVKAGSVPIVQIGNIQPEQAKTEKLGFFLCYHI